MIFPLTVIREMWRNLISIQCIMLKPKRRNTTSFNEGLVGKMGAGIDNREEKNLKSHPLIVFQVGTKRILHAP